MTHPQSQVLVTFVYFLHMCINKLHRRGTVTHGVVLSSAFTFPSPYQFTQGDSLWGAATVLCPDSVVCSFVHSPLPPTPAVRSQPCTYGSPNFPPPMQGSQPISRCSLRVGAAGPMQSDAASALAWGSWCICTEAV